MSLASEHDILNALTQANFTGTEDTKEDKSHTFTALLFAVFVIMLLLAIVAGTRVYSGLRGLQTSANGTRLGVSLISNMVHSNDSASSVATGQGPEGRSLVLREELESGTYETRIYLYQGYIVEEYTLEGSAYTPERASQIVESSTFSFSYEDGLLSISCDQGTSEVALRSLLGGA